MVTTKHAASMEKRDRTRRLFIVKHRNHEMNDGQLTTIQMVRVRVSPTGPFGRTTAEYCTLGTGYPAVPG